MNRRVYTLAWWMALPWLPLRLWMRGRREPGYRAAIGERFGRYADAPRPDARDVVWVHAVSVGETRAAAPLIARIESALPHARILLTAMTAAGRETGRQLYGDRVEQAWLPYDVPFAVERFLDRYRPRAGLLLETELWPNLVAACARRDVPVWLVNARLSPRSARGYARVGALAKQMLASLSGIAAQTEGDAQRLRALGARDVVVTGNLKFDIGVPATMRERAAALRASIGMQRRVWLAASTRDGEEPLVLDALAREPRLNDALLILVPRHPQRFEDVERMVRERGLRYQKRSAMATMPDATQVLVGDTMGEMFAYCGASDVAFVGGSLLPLGGQNLLEPIALGVPTIVGPHTFNFAEATERAIDAGAARRVADAQGMVSAVADLLDDAGRRAAMRTAALGFIDAHRGATDRLWRWLEPALVTRSETPR